MKFNVENLISSKHFKFEKLKNAKVVVIAEGSFYHGFAHIEEENATEDTKKAARIKATVRAAINDCGVGWKNSPNDDIWDSDPYFNETITKPKIVTLSKIRRNYKYLQYWKFLYKK